MIIDLAELAGNDPAKMPTLHSCDARGAFDLLSRELTIDVKTLRYPEVCEAAMRLAIDCTLGSSRIDG